MEPCKSILVRTAIFLSFLLAALPAFSQQPLPVEEHGTVAINVGEMTDKFGAFPSVNAADFGLDGQLTLIHAKDGGPNVVVGGELRVPSNTSTNPTEFAVFGGPHFPIGNFSIGFNAQVRKIIMPVAAVDGTTVPRFDFELLEIPVVLKYKFGPGHRAFIQVQGQPEFTPRFRMSHPPSIPVDKPNFDYGYTVRGIVGYNFGKWYVKGTYEDRIFKFISNQNNPLNLYNWHSTSITGGIGLNF